MTIWELQNQFAKNSRKHIKASSISYGRSWLDEHAAEMAKLKSENQRLLASLNDKLEPAAVAEVVKVVEPEVWKIKVVQGGETKESEFVIGEVEKEVPVNVPTNQKATPATNNKETSSVDPNSGNGEENPMQSLLNRLFTGS